MTRIITEFEQAVKAYLKYCKKNGYIYNQPSEYSSDFGKDGLYHLGNCNGLLAKYNFQTGKIVD